MEKEQYYIDTLILKCIDQTATTEEQAELLAWVQESESNKQYYVGQRKLHAHATLHLPSFDTENELLKTMQKAGVKDNLRPMWFSVAAAASILIIAGLWFLQMHGNAHIQKYAVQEQTSVLTSDSLSEMLLADGSHVWIAPESSVETLGYSETSRPLQMTGTAYYQVAKDSARPFSIDAGFMRVTVLGTAFQIRQRTADSSVTVSVTEGKVRVENMLLNTSAILLAGDECTMYHSHPHTQRTLSNENHFAWKTGVLDFKDTPLSEALVSLSDYYGRPFRLASDSLKGELFTARFDHASISDVQSVLALALSVNVSENADTIVVTPN